jgi:hypothetical protein
MNRSFESYLSSEEGSGGSEVDGNLNGYESESGNSRGVSLWQRKKFLQEVKKAAGLEHMSVKKIADTYPSDFGERNSPHRKKFQNLAQRYKDTKAASEVDYYAELEELQVKSYSQLQKEAATAEVALAATAKANAATSLRSLKSPARRRVTISSKASPGLRLSQSPTPLSQSPAPLSQSPTPLSQSPAPLQPPLFLPSSATSSKMAMVDPGVSVSVMGFFNCTLDKDTTMDQEIKNRIRRKYLVMTLVRPLYEPLHSPYAFEPANNFDEVIELSAKAINEPYHVVSCILFGKGCP